MLTFKQWYVEYVYRYGERGNKYAESIDFAVVIADSEEEAKRLVLEAAKTGVFDWAQHEFVGLRMLAGAKRGRSVVFSDTAIKMIQEHISGSYIERKEIDVDMDLPLGREG